MRSARARRLAPAASLALALAASLWLGAAGPGPADAQTLKLRSLKIYPSDIVGPWVSYKVRTQSGRHPVREFTQRVAIVGRAEHEGIPAFWVELKTSDPTRGARIERGLFAERPEAHPDSARTGFPEAVVRDQVLPLKLVTYQVLTSDGKLYEYPAESAVVSRAGGDVSMFELFEFDVGLTPFRWYGGPDTLRIGRRVVPAVVERSLRAGSDDWPSEKDSASVSRLVLSQSYWRNGAVPITGFARSLLRVSTVRLSVPSDSLGRVLIPTPPDSAMLAQADQAAADGHAPVLSWTELLLQDLGADAVAEVTQRPEPAPPSEEASPHEGPVR